MSIATWVRQLGGDTAEKLPANVFRYALATSGVHQLLLLGLTVTVFLLEVVPLELQRRIVNDLVKDRPYRWAIILCAVYAGVVLVQGGTKLILNVYRGWVGERAIRDLRHRIHSVIEVPTTSSPAAEAQGIAVSMIVAEVDPIGGFVGESVSEPLLQGGILASRARLPDPHRPVDGARRIRSLRPPVLLRPVDAGSGQPACRRAHPDIAPARDQRDRPDQWALSRRRSADRPGVCPRHGNL